MKTGNFGQALFEEASHQSKHKNIQKHVQIYENFIDSCSRYSSLKSCFNRGTLKRKELDCQ